ncbi:MAG TPA: hypothetical protein VMA09_21360 [Candidatus Binataceae bacterium]|nr:hypothetical protein [Candidatus Binataceae bacterium]
MASENGQSGAFRAIDKSDWNIPQPAKLPNPTFWPAAMALGINFAFFGVVTSWAFTIVGAGLFALSLGKWIGELVHDE